jgi:molybdate/tungstate transport system substrate-binding protein
LIKARPVVYGITIPTTVEHQEYAISFIKMLLSEVGQSIFNNKGQPPIVPTKASEINKIPEELREFVI